MQRRFRHHASAAATDADADFVANDGGFQGDALALVDILPYMLQQAGEHPGQAVAICLQSDGGARQRDGHMLLSDIE